MKKCLHCGEVKDFSQFYKLGKGTRPECKTCHNKIKKEHKNTVEGRAYGMAFQLFKRIGSDRKKDQCYKGIENRLGETKKEVQAVLLEHFYDEIKSLIEAGEVPSLDRIDSSGHYELGNVRIISFTENTRDGVTNAVKKTSKKMKVITPDGTETVFKSVSEASRTLGVKRDTIINNAKNGTVSKKGYRFKYV